MHELKHLLVCRWPSRGDFLKNYQLYVRREIQNQSSLRHPLIVSLREVTIAIPSTADCPHSIKCPSHYETTAYLLQARSAATRIRTSVDH